MPIIDRREFAFAMASGLIAAPSLAGSVASDVFDTRLGKIRGKFESGVMTFLGIRYAAAPVGELRFAAPRPAPAWTGVYDATTKRAAAMQGPAPELFSVPKTWSNSEDCLFLNVCTPAADGRRRPVMVWIHGGAYAIGSANEYQPVVLSKQGDVVVVCINYRLGIFGFTDMRPLDEGLAGSSNNGIRDQIAALRWVRDNIADYGGDPSNVTIFGCSAGGGSVLALNAAPEARGLFQKAIANSAVAGNYPPGNETDKLAKALNTPREQLLAKLRSVPAEDLIKVQVSAGLVFATTVDGVVIPKAPARAILENGKAQVPLIAGSTRDEGELFREVGFSGPAISNMLGMALMAGNPAPYLTRLKADYPTAPEGTFHAKVWTDTFRVAALQTVQAATKAGARSWLYRFDLPSTGRDGRLGAPHGAEVAFTFDQFADGNSPTGTGINALYDWRDPAVRRLGRQWSDTLIRFARGGDPNGGGLPRWPVYEDKTRPAMVLDKISHVVRNLDDQVLARTVGAYNP